jgi:hypothetical protein
MGMFPDPEIAKMHNAKQEILKKARGRIFKFHDFDNGTVFIRCINENDNPDDIQVSGTFTHEEFIELKKDCGIATMGDHFIMSQVFKIIEKLMEGEKLKDNNGRTLVMSDKYEIGYQMFYKGKDGKILEGGVVGTFSIGQLFNLARDNSIIIIP